jgi:MoaD family protein
VTKGEKTVSAEGATVADLIADLDSRYTGLGDRLVKNGALHRFVNIYVNDEDVRFTGGLETTVADGDQVTILPAVAGGAEA